jgi:hypothetical protein
LDRGCLHASRRNTDCVYRASEIRRRAERHDVDLERTDRLRITMT